MVIKFHDYKKIKRISQINNRLFLGDEEPYSGSVTDRSGEYEILNDILISVFSYQNQNYLLLGDQLINLTNSIWIEKFIAENIHTESWFKIYNNDKMIFEIKYVNPHEPFVLPDPFAYDEDFKTTNFAHHLAEYISHVQKEPSTVLFKPV